MGVRAAVARIKEVIKHYDMMEREITPGCFVVAELNAYRNLEMCIVDKVNPKMIRLKSIKANKFGRHYTANKYPTEMMIITDQNDVTMYILKNIS